MLTVYTEDENPPAAKEVYNTAIHMNGYRIARAEMYGFCTSTIPDCTTALGTTSAGPCQIIVIHAQDKTGAPSPTKGPRTSLTA
jgi:hypothetical protein